MRESDEEDILGHGGREDDSLSFLVGGDCHLLASVLVRNERSHIGLDSTSSNTNQNNGSDEAPSASSIHDRIGKRRGKQYKETDNVDQGKNHDCVISSKILIGNDCACDRSHITPKLER